jgi:hypothetical protein
MKKHLPAVPFGRRRHAEAHDRLDARWKHTHRARHHCLRCFRLLPPDSDRCDACGTTSRLSDRRIYWNRVPSIVRTEWAVKLCAVVLSMLLVFLIPLVGIGTAGGYVCMLPFGFAVAAWKTASKLTRHEPYFRPSIVWTASIALAAIALGLLRDLSWLALSILALPVLLVCQDSQRWKEHLIARGARSTETD